MAGRQGLATNGRYIQTLYLASPTMFDLLHLSCCDITTNADPAGHYNSYVSSPLATCTQLKKLVLWYRQSNLNVPPDVEAGMMTLVQQNPRLISVDILGRVSPSIILTFVRGSFSALRKLKICSSYIHPRTARTVLNNLPETVTTLHLMGIDSRGLIAGSEEIDEAGPSKAICHHALRSLLLYYHLAGFEEYLLLPFLKTCGTNLLEFDVLGVGCFGNALVADALAKIGIHLDTWDAVDSDDESEIEQDDAAAADFLAINKCLRHIHLGGCFWAGPQTAAAILRLYEPRYLYLHCHSMISSLDVRDILSKIASLEVFAVNEGSEFCASMNPLLLSAREFLVVEWATTSLRGFGCIIRVPCPNKHVPVQHQDSAYSTTLEHSREVQRQVYRQIAKQPHLVVLYLGAFLGTAVDPQRLWYSLEMTLGSRLDELAGLSEMRMLAVDHINHRIDVQDLEWMTAHWPNLGYIRGLNPQGEELSADVQAWVSLHQHLTVPSFGDEYIDSEFL